MSKKRMTLFAMLLLVMIATGVTIGWMQDVQNSKILMGQIIDEQSKAPVPGANIRLTRQVQDVRETMADGDGRYRMAIGNGPLTVTVQARGYQSTVGPFEPSDALLKEYVLNIVLRPYLITGTVKDRATQQPIIYASLDAGDAHAQSTDNGKFVLSPVVPDSTLHIEARGYYPQEVKWNGESTMEFALTPRTIAIAVHSAGDGQPLKATVLVNGTKYKADGQGRVVVREPEPNSKIIASLDDFATAQATFTGQALIELALKPSSFRGALKDSKTGKPVAGATIYLNGVATLTSSDEGKFGLSDVPPGTPLKLKAPGYNIVETVVPNSPTMEFMMRPFAARGVYLPFGLLANEAKVRGLIDLIDRTELNALVVDVKGDRGRLAFHSDNPIIKSIGSELVTMDLRELLRIAHEKKIYVIARIVVFKDDPLTKARPEWAVKTKSGAVWKDAEQLGWANPYLHEVWDYNLAIAKEAAALGFDEIQFDYIRFPSDGDVNNIVFLPTHTPETRASALRGFLTEANKLLKPYAVFISADVFGMTLWTRDDMGIGQRLEEIAQQVDYVQPMVYPSTFSSGNLGYANPSLHPYEVIFRSMKSAAERITTPIRPWLQHYSSRDVAYGLQQFLAQKRAANDAGTAGWTFWNSSGEYNPNLFVGQ